MQSWANSLVKHGIKTVILESGPDPRGKSIDPRFQQLDSYRSSGPIEYPVVSSRFRGVGGTSWLWGGMCPRLHPIDFEKNSYTPPGASWPISYEDLQPYYEQAEQALRVRGWKKIKVSSAKKYELSNSTRSQRFAFGIDADRSRDYYLGCTVFDPQRS